MKRIAVMILSIMVMGSLFAVTGEVFTKIKGGTVDVANTGFKLNYDSFGLEYKFLGKANILDVDAYSPGYVNITGIKAGMLSFGLGWSSYIGYDNIEVKAFSNGTKALVSDAAKFAYQIDLLPRIALNIGKINITTSDQSEFYWAESVQQKWQLSNNNSNIVENTDARIDQRKLVVKIGANMKGAWNGELGGYDKIGLYWKQSLGTFNENMNNELNTWGDFALPLGDAWEFYVKGWFKWTTYDNKTKLVVPGVTNESGERGSEMYVGPEVRMQYKIAGGQVKLNLGIGLASMLSKQSFNYVTMSSNTKTNIVTTNAVESWYTLYGVKRDDNRALMQFGGSTKFGDWEFGMDSRLDFTIALYKQTVDPNTKTVQSQWMNDTAPWSEPLFIPIVKTIYLKYSKSMFTVTFNLINPDQERGAYEDTGVGFGTDATKRWFYSVDFSYKF